MAEGLLHPKNEKRIEEVGEEYFEDLIARSFFQLTSEDETTLSMHDLMHDLAIFVNGEFSLDMDDTKFPNCVSKIRHLSYKGGADDPEEFEGLSKAKGLRTFLTIPRSIWDPILSLPVEHLLKSLLCTESCVRVLSLIQCEITKLPSSIGDLKYLKYLNLSYTSIREIPDTICNLYNLQTLLLEGCDNVERLPMNIGNLINLRHLSVPRSLKEMPVQIGLKNKEFLSELYLNFVGDSDAPVDLEKERVLDALKPHTNLKKLYIRYYKGNNFPDWVENHLYCNLVHVSIVGCNTCCSLPPLGQLSSLKQLFIWECNSVERISREFYYSSAAAEKKPFRSLETLGFRWMSNLREWSFMEGEVEGGIFPRLKELTLSRCEKLKVSLPDYLPSLRKLRIESCEQLLPLVPNNGAQQMDTAFPSLEILQIYRCNGQDSVLEGGLPSSLKQIRIENCRNLRALDEEAFQRLTSLESLIIRYCDNLLSLPRGLPTSLSDLGIFGCQLLEQRVERETGEDWPIIANIPNVNIRCDSDSD